MKKIRVYLKKPLIFGDSPYYDYLTKEVSPKIEYINTENKNQGIIRDIKRFKLVNILKRLMKIILRNLFPGMPNAHFVKQGDYDLIHCAHCLTWNKKPWVADIEYVNQFWAGGIPKKQRKVILKLLKSEYCKKILAWTMWAKKEILEVFPEIKNKIEVVYPALPIQNFKRKKSNKINLLFVSRRFFFKGGLHALEVMDRLTKKHKYVFATIISDIPEEIIEKYSTNKKINFMRVLPKERLFLEIYPKANILIYPSYTDTFGFTIIEALSFGIPVISVDGQSRRELIRDGKTGFIIEKPKEFDLKELKRIDTLAETIKEIENKTEILIKNKKLREKMSKNCLQEFKSGKFSVVERNKKLERIYELAIKR